ncbi:hypothetical protein [Methylosinus sporium]|uniref:hypothetical protein n=1 Tax=Methylosinus sporium TaxID=428 RepID=UPI00383B8E65
MPAARLYSDQRVGYWRKGMRELNFGDALSELLYRELTKRNMRDRRAGRYKRDFDVVRLIGSVISDHQIEIDLTHSRADRAPKIAFWCCGKRDPHPLNEELQRHCVFLGARGPLTRDALGLPAETPLGDPALLLPLLYAPRIDPGLADKSICVPHFLEPKSDRRLIEETGVDLVVRPNIAASFDAIRRAIDQIVSARFVLCGALHAAILRCAYNLPFGYFDSGYVDVPFKWDDFAGSIGVGARFASNLPQGEAYYAEDLAGKIRKPDLLALLDCAPIIAPRALRARAKELK